MSAKQDRFQPRLTRADLLAAAHRTVADVIAPGLDVLFCGINPGLYSAATGHHFARPGNRFWPALHAAGFTPRLLAAAEERQLLEWRLGITNLVRRASAKAEELSAAELRAGRAALERKVRRHRPAWLAVVGIGAYRVAFDEPRASTGPQARRIAETGVWVLPNTSGLNANHQLGALAGEFRRLRRAAAAARKKS